MKDRIARQGDIIVIAEKEFPVQQIRYVDVVFQPPRRFVLFAAISLTSFLLTAVSLGVMVMLSIFWENANPQAISWAVAVIFFTGAAIFAGTMIFAMVAYPIEWRVEVATAQGIYVAKVERSRTRATIFANRLKRLLPGYEVPFE